MDARAHMHTHAHTHAHTYADAHTSTQHTACTHMHTTTHMHTHAHTCTHTHVYFVCTMFKYVHTSSGSDGLRCFSSILIRVAPTRSDTCQRRLLLDSVAMPVNPAQISSSMQPSVLCSPLEACTQHAHTNWARTWARTWTRNCTHADAHTFQGTAEHSLQEQEDERDKQLKLSGRLLHIHACTHRRPHMHARTCMHARIQLQFKLSGRLLHIGHLYGGHDEWHYFE